MGKNGDKVHCLSFMMLVYGFLTLWTPADVLLSYKISFDVDNYSMFPYHFFLANAKTKGYEKDGPGDYSEPRRQRQEVAGGGELIDNKRAGRGAGRGRDQ